MKKSLFALAALLAATSTSIAGPIAVVPRVIIVPRVITVPRMVPPHITPVRPVTPHVTIAPDTFAPTTRPNIVARWTFFWWPLVSHARRVPDDDREDRR